MTTDTTHITKEGLLLAINEGSDDLYRPVLLARAAELSDQSEARKAEVPETEALKPCPFCGGKCDPEGWIGDKKRSGPACDDCGSAAETVAIWNNRAAELESQAQPFAYTYCSCCKERIPAPAKWLLGYQLCDACIAAWKVSGSGVNITVQACHENPKLWDRPSQAQPPDAVSQAKGETCPECGAVLLVECVACSHTTFPQQAQPPADELSAQESKPVAGWEITMTADDPYPPIIKLRRPDGVGMVLTKGDFVYPYFAELAAPPVSAQDASPKDGWQPISTAPKDGTNILLVNVARNIATGMWQQGKTEEYSGWVLRGGNRPNVFFNGHHGPTHWQPLPRPPQ